MRLHIWTYCRYICLSVLAALLVTGMPGESKARSFADIFNVNTNHSSFCVDMEGTGPCQIGATTTCTNSKQEVCSITCYGPKGGTGTWGSGYNCHRPKGSAAPATGHDVYLNW